MLAALACRSDGQHDASEEALVRRRLGPHLVRLGRGGQERTVQRLYEILSDQGLDGTLETLRKALPGRDERVAAMRLAGEIIDSDGTVTREEMEHLARVGERLGVRKADLGL